MFVNPEYLEDLHEIARQYFSGNPTMLRVFEEELSFARTGGGFRDEPLNIAISNEYYSAMAAIVPAFIPGAAIAETKARRKRFLAAIKAWGERKAKEMMVIVTERFQGPTPVATQNKVKSIQGLAVSRARKPRRQDLLAPLVKKALKECGSDAALVFSLMRQWAAEKPPRPPLVGVTEDGIQWRDSKDEVPTLSRRALSARIKRAR